MTSSSSLFPRELTDASTRRMTRRSHLSNLKQLNSPTMFNSLARLKRQRPRVRSWTNFICVLGADPLIHKYTNTWHPNNQHASHGKTSILICLGLIYRFMGGGQKCTFSRPLRPLPLRLWAKTTNEVTFLPTRSCFPASCNASDSNGKSHSLTRLHHRDNVHRNTKKTALVSQFESLFQGC